MKINVDRLSREPVSEVFDGTQEWWAEARQSIEELLAEPFHFECQIHMIGADINVEGKVTGALELPCARCLARYRHAVSESFRLVLEPVGDRSPIDAEGEKALSRDGVYLGDELGSGWFRGREIKLGTYFLEIIALSFPVKPLCREECLGLCPKCGIDRNSESCNCNESNPASPFAALEALKGKLKEGEN